MELIAEKRTTFGKKNKALRKEKKLPGVIFGKGLESISVTVNTHDFTKVFAQAGETELVDLNVVGTTSKVLIKEIQYHPITSEFLHVNFHKVNLKEKIQAEIPIEIVGEENNDLIKSNEAILLLILNEVAIEALPTDLPNSFAIDVSELSEIGQGVSISELSFDKDKIDLIGHEDDDLIAKLDYAVQEEVDEEEEELTEEEMLEGVEATKEKDIEEENASKGDTSSKETATPKEEPDTSKSSK